MISPDVRANGSAEQDEGQVSWDYIFCKFFHGDQGLLSFHYVFAGLPRITLCIYRVAKDCTQIMAEIQDVRAATDEVGRSKVSSNFDNLQKVVGKAFE